MSTEALPDLGAVAGNRPEGPPLAELPRRLAPCGYADFVASHIRFGCDMKRMNEARLLAPEPLRPVLDLFLFGGEAALRDLPRPIEEMVPTLESLDVVCRRGDRVRSTGLSLLNVFGRWIFSQQLLPAPAVYFGDDTLALMQRLTPPVGGSVLDLCSGPGTLALHCAGFAGETVAVEINPAASAVARLNVAMNGLTGAVRLCVGDLYEPVQGRRFDLITANPPLIPLPDGVRFPFVGNGGADGFAVTRRIVRSAAAHLKRDGAAQIIGTCLSDGLLPAVVDLLEQDLPGDLDALATVTAHMPCRRGDWQFEILAATAGNGAGDDDPRDLLEDLLQRGGATHLAYFQLRLAAGSGEITIMDLSNDDGPSALWYA